MGGLFGKGKRADRERATANASQSSPAAPPPQVDESDIGVLELKLQRDQIVAQKRKVTKQVERDTQAARDAVKQDKKSVAMLALRKKKFHEQLLQDCEAHLLKIDELISSVEMAKVQKEVVEAMKAGTATLKKIQQEIGGADYVAKVMDDSAEAMAEMKEINDLLAGEGVAADDADALAEYAMLEELAAKEKLAAAAPAPVPDQEKVEAATPAADPAPVPSQTPADPAPVPSQDGPEATTPAAAPAPPSQDEAEAAPPALQPESGSAEGGSAEPAPVPAAEAAKRTAVPA